ncbi:MAG: argininosuccinate lyase [Candidatus Omnitrophica bacterium]|nr:argininosuccinate lyase [Candidatus Omnitrophota bacterium]
MGYMWAGRFKGKVESRVIDFTSSLDIDKRLALYDIKGSIAHAKMLAKCGIVTAKEGRNIAVGLEKIKEEIEKNRFRFKPSDEDIHTAVERRLTEIAGRDGERLHTARSRNDQIVLDERLFLKDVIKEISGGIKGLQKALVAKAEEVFPCIMPAYTHLQQSQPVLASHYFLAYTEMLERDKQRLADAYKRVDVLPSGVCACCGTSLPVDREYLAGLLGFSGISRNSLDTVASRDFLLEPAGACAVLMLNLSRFSEDIIIWSTSEFGFVELPDSYCTGSSILPQKKNPDVLELIRGRAASSAGMLAGLMALLKGLPLSYNRDLQEDKRLAFGIFEDAAGSLGILADIVPALAFNGRAAEKALSEFTLATDAAEYLVKKGIPFRQAHGICGAMVRYCLEKNKSAAALDMKEWKSFSPEFSEDIKKVLNFKGSVRAKSSYGGTSPELVKKEISRWRKALK